MDFVTSDLHFGHENIIKFSNRPFQSVAHMNSMLISNWNERVAPEDKVFIVGDYAMGDKALWPSYRAQLNGTICLVMGNHDSKGKKFSHEENKAFMLECGFDEVVDEVYYESHGLVWWMAHYPPNGHDRYTDERGYQRPKATRNYDILLFGHTHSHTIYDVPGALHVGIDGTKDYAPRSMDEMYELWKAHPFPYDRSR
jgi:calcineurin-like phosphoesterase family protein